MCLDAYGHGSGMPSEHCVQTMGNTPIGGGQERGEGEGKEKSPGKESSSQAPEDAGERGQTKSEGGEAGSEINQ